MTSGCFLLPSGSCAGTGIVTLNGLIADPQSFAVSTGQNTTLDIDSITDTHTFKLVDGMTPQWQSFRATSTTATSTIDASFSARNLTVSGYLDVSRIIATSTTQSTFRGGIGTPIGSIISFDAPTDNITIQSDDGTALQFFVNGSTEGLIINNANVATFAGNVGIGTTSPASLLSVQGNGLFSGNLTAANLTATGTISLLGLGRDMLLTTDSSGNLVASSSPVVGYLTATSTTASSTFSAGITTAGLSSSNGLTITGGDVLLPNSVIDNAELKNSSLTVTAGSGLTGGGAISLGGSATLNAASAGTLTVSADSIDLNLGNANTWTAAQSFSYTATSTFSGGIKLNGGLDTTYISSSGRLELGTGLATSTIRNFTTNGGGFNVASSSGITPVAINLISNLFGVTIINPSTASTTIILPAKPYPFIATHAVCVVNGATNVVIRLIDPSGNATNNITATQTSTTTEQTFTSNNTFTRYEGTSLQIVSVSGNPNQLNCSIIGTKTAQ